MFEWFSGLFGTKGPQQESPSPKLDFTFWDDVVDSTEWNVLVLAGLNQDLGVLFEEIRRHLANVRLFVRNLCDKEDNGIDEPKVDIADLDVEFLKQKSLAQSTDQPPSCFVFKHCVENGDESYRQVIQNGKRHCLSTITIVKDPWVVDPDLLQHMDVLVMLKNRKTDHRAWIYEKFLKAHSTFENFKIKHAQYTARKNALIVTSQKDIIKYNLRKQSED